MENYFSMTTTITYVQIKKKNNSENENKVLHDNDLEM